MNTDNKAGWREFLRLCQRVKTEDQLDELFGLFFTLEEKDVLATRILLIQELLKAEKTQREIAQHLNISIAKITRGSNALKIVSDEMKQFILQDTK